LDLLLRNRQASEPKPFEHKDRIFDLFDCFDFPEFVKNKGRGALGKKVKNSLEKEKILTLTEGPMLYFL
jgi:hypothetical protein